MSAPSYLSRLYETYEKYPLISTDSRNVSRNSIFFALRGKSFDGNRFAAEALERGAALAVVDDPQVIPPTLRARVTEYGACEEGYFLVENSLTALQSLASMHRELLRIPVMAITGTNGKTTTKELTAAVLSEKFRVCATKGNLNNHIGVPLTLLSIPSDAEFAIVEMGASAIGEIADLCRIARPDYGVVTNVGIAHLEGFGSEEGVRRAKGELYDWLAQEGGRAFVCRDDDTLASMATQRKGLHIIWYDASEADNYRTRLVGSYNCFNIATAAAVGRWFGVPETSIYQAVRDYTPSSNRSQVVVTQRNTVIADCYNANPSSMMAALEWFGSISPQEFDDSSDGKAAVLGDMLELGERSAEEHRKVLQRALTLELRKLVLIGSRFQEAAAGIDGELTGSTTVVTFPDTESYISFLRRNTLATGKTVLLKGSRGIALERLLKYL